MCTRKQSPYLLAQSLPIRESSSSKTFDTGRMKGKQTDEPTYRLTDCRHFLFVSLYREGTQCWIQLGPHPLRRDAGGVTMSVCQKSPCDKLSEDIEGQVDDTEEISFAAVAVSSFNALALLVNTVLLCIRNRHTPQQQRYPHRRQKRIGAMEQERQTDRQNRKTERTHFTSSTKTKILANLLKDERQMRLK